MQPAHNTRPIEYAVNAVLLANPEKVQRYQSATGREKLAICGFFVGMKFKILHGKGIIFNNFIPEDDFQASNVVIGTTVKAANYGNKIHALRP